MGETTPHTNPPCEQLLDYVYGELDEAGKRAFEEHLPGCPRCQADVASFGRVRTAARRLMPAVEPPAQLTGAAHAQLMHAAAQRKPRRGVLLAFPRKLMQRPAWAAAAMFVIVGGAVALNWSRGKMAMPVAEQAPPAPAAKEPLPLEKNKEAVEADKAEAYDAKLGTIGKGGSNTKIALQTPSGQLKVDRPPARHAKATAAPAKTAPAKMKGISTDALASDDGFGSLGGGVEGGAAAPSPKSSAPSSAARLRKAEEKKGGRDEGYGVGAAAPAGQPQTWAQSASPPPPPPRVGGAAPAPAMVSESAEREKASARSSVQPQAAVQAVKSPARDVEALRKRADDAARSGRCEEAIKLYQQLDKLSQYITPTERLNYVHCLTATDRQDQAQQQLDELKADKRVTNAQVQQVESELTVARRRGEAAKKAAKKPAAAAPPADRAAQQRRAAEPAAPPAESAPTSVDTRSRPSY